MESGCTGPSAARDGGRTAVGWQMGEKSGNADITTVAPAGRPNVGKSRLALRHCLQVACAPANQFLESLEDEHVAAFLGQRLPKIAYACGGARGGLAERPH